MADRDPVSTRSGGRLVADLEQQLASDRVKLDREWVLLSHDEARSVIALAKAATDVYQRLHRAHDYREKEALWSALEAAVEAVNG